jgi:hypothetical protein
VIFIVSVCKTDRKSVLHDLLSGRTGCESQNHHYLCTTPNKKNKREIFNATFDDAKKIIDVLSCETLKAKFDKRKVSPFTTKK